MATKTINADMLARMFLAGAQNIEANKETINELNVFPVPDGDTGTNMSLTIMSAAKEVMGLPDRNMKDLAKAISSGSLRGARGNSGVILSQLLRGFTKALREMEAEEFIDRILHKVLRAAHIVVGTDFSFGYGKRGNAALLQKMADQYGYTVDVIEKERYLGTVISSTYIKDALAQGDVKLAERLLGFPYEMTGIVRHGKQLGRTLGFPTMNIEPEKNKILPRFGVYACRVRIDGKWYDAVGNAGIKPTVTDEQRRLLEVYVYGYDGDAYGKEITAQFCEFERPETKFGSVEELKNNVMRDMRYGERYFAALREKSGE